MFAPSVLLTAHLALADDPPTAGVVTSVYDGDTLTLSTGEKIRLRWVNTPEIKPLEDGAYEAREATRRLCLDQRVKLTVGTIEYDSYGRLIASVECQGQDLGNHLLERGLGHVFIIPPDDLPDPSVLLGYQDAAREARAGIWRFKKYRAPLHITSFHVSARDALAGEYMRVANMSDEDIDLTGYTITNRAGQRWTLPSVTVPEGHTVKVYTGRGIDQTAPDRQQEVFLGNPEEVFDNTNEKVVIWDRDGNAVVTRRYKKTL